MSKAAHQFDPNIEVFNVDIRKEEDVRMLIMVLLFAVPRDIHDENDK